IDQIFFKDIGTKLDASPGRMALPTALNFILTALAFFLAFQPKGSTPRKTAQILMMEVLMVSWISFAGYLLGTPYLLWVGTWGSLAINTALAFILVATGYLALFADEGFMFVLTADSSGGVSLRRLLSWSLFFPLAIGYFILSGEHAGLYSLEFGVTIM